MSYIANYTNTYDIRGHEIEITAPARFDDQAAKLALQKFRKIYGVVSPEKMKNLWKNGT